LEASLLADFRAAARAGSTFVLVGFARRRIGLPVVFTGPCNSVAIDDRLGEYSPEGK
jgi:hypothetical protein